MKKKKLPYTTYKEEREMLSKMESTNYENYEKTMLTLSAAFLAFSVSFLGLFKAENGPVLVNQFLLVLSWVLFALSVTSILIGFLVGALALRFEVRVLEEALADINSLNQKNNWTSTQYVLYVVAGTSFIAGVVFLVLFCANNIGFFAQ